MYGVLKTPVMHGVSKTPIMHEVPKTSVKIPQKPLLIAKS